MRIRSLPKSDRREVLFRSARLQALALERALFLHGVRRQLFRGRRSPTTSIRTIPGNGGCLNARPKDATWKPNVDDGKKVLARVTDGLKPSAAARRIFFKPLVMTLCGEVAQRRAGWDRSDEYHRVRCGNDRKQWLSVLDAITETRADGVAMMREMISEAHRIIDAHWDVLEELARGLLQYRKLDEHEIKQIVGDLSPVFNRLLPTTNCWLRTKGSKLWFALQLRARDGTNRGTKLGHVRDGPR
jgi:hypothetical protein